MREFPANFIALLLDQPESWLPQVRRVFVFAPHRFCFCA
jgi:hypothetical protein